VSQAQSSWTSGLYFGKFGEKSKSGAQITVNTLVYFCDCLPVCVFMYSASMTGV
jgi:hypothetical protein